MADPKSYRETALELAVESHGTVQEGRTVFGPYGTQTAVVVSVPNEPQRVVEAALEYERFLDRSWSEPEEHADALAAVLEMFVEEGDGSPLGEAGRIPLDGYRAWKARRKELF